MIPFVDNNKVAHQKVCIYIISLLLHWLYLFSLCFARSSVHSRWIGARSPDGFCFYCSGFIKKVK